VRTEGVELRALVPVSIRGEDERGALGNRVAAMMAPLPVWCQDPVARLDIVREELKDRITADSSELEARAIKGDQTQRLTSVSAANRIALWQIAWENFREHPLTGTGGDTYQLIFEQNRPASSSSRRATWSSSDLRAARSSGSVRGATGGAC
jgi:hypothetical protein